MKKSMDNFLPYYLIRSICSILLIVFQFPTAIAQNLEVDGKVKVIEMDSIGTGEKIVVRDPNSILAECNVDNIIISYFLSLPNGTATLVEAGESAANLLALGATVANLLNAGVSVGELLATGVSVNELVTAGATVSSLLEAGAVPLDI
ncbi:MAG: hypothetical protein KDC53_06340, partial [Saprospiraceae bacterium]|nr:hypothetical protein [Saprospiraceae bacterium]